MNRGDIKGFHLTGQMADATFVTTRERLEREIEAGMRDEGFVPHLDLIPLFTVEYAGDGVFNFDLTIYGVYVGEEWSSSVAGVTDGKEILRSVSTLQTT